MPEEMVKQKEKLKILIVEDNRLNREILCEQLRSDYEIIEAENGEEALKIMGQSRDDLAMVLLDEVLPGKSGLDVLKTMNDEGWINELPVIMISSEDPEELEPKAFQLGASDYIIRHYDLAFLKKRIQNCISLSVLERTEISRINQAADELKDELEADMSSDSILKSLRRLKNIYDIVRLVDVAQMVEYSLNEKNHLVKGQHRCFEVWEKNSRCENCISSKAALDHGRHSKYEFIGNDIYLALAKYIEIDGIPFILELVSKADDDIFLDAVGKDALVKSILAQNEKIYVDALTGAYNRHYYEEQLQHLAISAIAIIDLDHFKAVNDTYGHLAGDAVLKSVASVIRGNIRKTDALIRYGGDEFVVVFAGIGQEHLKQRLEVIRQAVEVLVFEDYPGLKCTLSIGGVAANHCDDIVFREADQRLYEAKQTRNCVMI